MTDAIWFDGENAVEHRAPLTLDGDSLLLGGERIPLADLQRVYANAGEHRFARRSVEGWRMIVEGALAPDLAAALPAATVVPTPPVSRKAAAIGGAACALVLGAIGSLFLAPHLLARQLPLPVERKIGQAVEIPATVPRCDNPAAIAALDKLVDKLDPDARADGYSVEILAFSDVNAAALPGGRIVLLQGLLDAAGRGEAVAGVLAHEMAHVRRRHVAAAAVRNLGLRGLVAVLGGSRLSEGAGGLLSLKFTRDAEAEADADAVAMLERAGINPRPTAEMFDYLEEMEGEPYVWLASHPASGGRAKAFRSSFRLDGKYRPALSVEEEDALFGACRWPFIQYRDENVG